MNKQFMKKLKKPNKNHFLEFLKINNNNNNNNNNR
jgi:preprotein translocase subunit Sss1